MAGESTSTLLNGAGFSPDQFGLEALLDLPNNSVFMGMGGPTELISVYNIAKGKSLYAPVLAGRSATTVDRDASSGITATAISGTKVTFSKQFAYDALKIMYPELNDMEPENLAALLTGYRSQAVAAMANQFDSDILGLYSSASVDVGAGGTDISISVIAEAKKALKVANAPEPYFMVLPVTQEDHLSQIDELTRYDARGEGGSMVNGGSFYRWQGVNIYTTGNCPTASGTAHGLAFSKMGIRANFRTLPEIRDWDEPKDLARYLMVMVDYAYANSFADWIVDVNLNES